jgi:hypothetical protein
MAHPIMAAGVFAVAVAAAATPPRGRCEEPGPREAPPPLRATVSVGDGLAVLEVLFDRHRGRVTVCAFEGGSGEPLRLRANVLSLYATPDPSEEGSAPIHVWLDPFEPETDDLGIKWATRFSGESPRLRGAGAFDGLLSQLLVHSRPFWAITFHVTAPRSSAPRR